MEKSLIWLRLFEGWMGTLSQSTEEARRSSKLTFYSVSNTISSVSVHMGLRNLTSVRVLCACIYPMYYFREFAVS